jgi:hypothetical protein
MHGDSNVKFISAQQARMVYQHQNIRMKAAEGGIYIYKIYNKGGFNSASVGVKIV